MSRSGAMEPRNPWRFADLADISKQSFGITTTSVHLFIDKFHFRRRSLSVDLESRLPFIFWAAIEPSACHVSDSLPLTSWPVGDRGRPCRLDAL